MGDGPQKRIHDALRVAEEWGQIDGAHHKQWVIDQMVRALTGYRENLSDVRRGFDAEYLDWVAQYKGEWDEGIAP